MSRRELPSEEETARFGCTWERYLRRTTLRAMQEGGPEAWRAAIFRIVERVLRLRRWERRCAVLILVARAMRTCMSEEIERRAERHARDRVLLGEQSDDAMDRAMDRAHREAERLHRAREEATE